jgi:death on curing protein
VARRREPDWLPRIVIEAIHTDQMREHGGLPGLRDENSLEAALARPRQKWAYGRRPGLASLAAACAFGLIRNHPFRDGNKRVGFLAMAAFLDIHGYDFDAEEADVVTMIFGVAAGSVSEKALAAWIRKHMSKIQD